MLDRVKALGSHLRRQIYTEEKAKVVAAVWGTELIQLLAAQAILHQYDLKNRMNSYFSSFHPDAIYPFLYIIRVQLILFFISSWCKIASAERNNQFCPSNSSEELCLLFCLYPSSMCTVHTVCTMYIHIVTSSSPLPARGRVGRAACPWV